MSGAIKWPGNPVPLGGQTYTFPRLSFGDMEELKVIEMIEGGGLDSLSQGKQMALIIDMAHRSLRRNNPDIPRAEVAALLDQDTAVPVFQAIMNITGFDAVRESAAGNPAGEGAGAGQPSTPT